MTDSLVAVARGNICLHRTPANAHIHDWFREHRGESLDAAAAALGMITDNLCAALGIRVVFGEPHRDLTGPGDVAFTMRAEPDGITACWDSDCPNHT